ncbi:S-adenosylmethionine decarboxylase [Catenaria anguillulae PL171]|uniref:S-adenosylmethionine decarboxylase n=1 Tax=Catenaria anguillulae PL171 TaxID=765915 RepID=A0A1Y2H6Z6_9FUNG|nr:S-adenosylmethionine decarboxylase [Catenaria anguillulae PL171]
MSFEGAEKLLEIWFHAGSDDRHTAGSVLNNHHNNSPTLSSTGRMPVASSGAAAVRAAAEEAHIITPALSDNDDEDESALAWPNKKRRVGEPVDPAQALTEVTEAHLAAEKLKGNEALVGGGEGGKLGLRAVTREQWQDMLDLVKCTILNVISNEYADAYLLSESSLFVFPNRIILKTCGTTTLLLSLPRILQIASDLCGYKVVDKLFYSRMCFQFPEKQHWPHSSWDHEVEILDGIFANGSSYVMGKTNSDHWYLYVAGEQLIPRQVAKICPQARALVVEGEQQQQQQQDEMEETEATGEAEKPVHEQQGSAEDVHANLAALTAHGTDPPDLLACVGSRVPGGGSDVMDCDTASVHSAGSSLSSSSSVGSCASCGSSAVVEDRTLEMLMTGLDQEQMRKFFFQEGNKHLGDGTANHVEAATGLDKLLPGCISDSFLFSPCGWSQNALLGEYYGTFHVTPEEACSYASFETNVPLSNNEDDPLSYKAVTSRVLDVYRPTNVTLTHFSNDVGVHPNPIPPTLPVMQLEGYRLVDVTVNVLPHYHLFYCHYVRECPETGKALRPKKARRLVKKAKAVPVEAVVVA